VISILLLGAVGTGLAYIWYSNVINAWGATVASTVTYLTPIVGVLLGILVLNERIRWNQMLGGVIVVFSVLIGQGRFTLRSSPLGRRRAHALRSLPDPKGHHGTLR
jgi:drug/metabolite transporter (DMT)-like permease